MNKISSVVKHFKKSAVAIVSVALTLGGITSKTSVQLVQAGGTITDSIAITGSMPNIPLLSSAPRFDACIVQALASCAARW